MCAGCVPSPHPQIRAAGGPGIPTVGRDVPCRWVLIGDSGAGGFTQGWQGAGEPGRGGSTQLDQSGQRLG